MARLNVLLHGVKGTEFDIHHGNSLRNNWALLTGPNPAKEQEFDPIVANLPVSYCGSLRTCLHVVVPTGEAYPEVAVK